MEELDWSAKQLLGIGMSLDWSISIIPKESVESASLLCTLMCTISSIGSFHS